MKPLSVGLAGYGVEGKQRRTCIDQHPQLRLTAVCDQLFTNSGVFPDGVCFYPDYKQLLAKQLDVLLVCLTNDLLSAVTIAGLERGLHYFVKNCRPAKLKIFFQ